MIQKTYILSLFLSLLLVIGCGEEERLSPNSVVESNVVARKQTELSQWIMDNYTRPYGIEVNYRWNKNTAPTDSYTYPPTAENVQAVLEAIKALWIDVYTHPEIGGEKFLQGKRPLVIHLYGGGNKDANGVERLSHAQAPAVEMHLYNVNEFDPKDESKVFLLLRSVHHQFAKRLMEVYPYDRDAFLQISRQKYTYSSKFMVPLIEALSGSFYRLNDYANKRGFYTLHAFLTPEDDFAEIISSTLLHSPKELAQAEERAKTPDVDLNPAVQDRYNKEAEEAYREFVAKRHFVTNYFQKEVNILLPRLQIISVSKLRSYLEKKKKS